MISRRGLFSSLLDTARRAVEEAEAPSPPPACTKKRPFPLHRPPGAVEESDFLARCSRCGECLKACPHQAIVKAPLRLREAAGTPVIEAAENPCRHCSDTPCAQVCEPGVLRADYPQKMGQASVATMDCLAWQGSFCTVCFEQCPIEGVISLDQGKPVIDARACTGCGVCLYVCPAPRKAILLLPEQNRPPWKPADE